MQVADLGLEPRARNHQAGERQCVVLHVIDCWKETHF
jgi:hypothetical protein